MGNALVITASKTGETAELGALIVEGLRETGTRVEEIKAEAVASDEQLTGYDAYILGTSVYNERILPEMETVLRRLARLQVGGKIGAAFGSYEWNPEVLETLSTSLQEEVGLLLAAPVLANKPPLLGHTEEEARELGRTVGRKLAKG